MLYGAAYYPEHWGEDRIEQDARLMADAGFNVARMGEFAWKIMQPDDSPVYEFSWLDNAVKILGKYGISSILCTPTATPPKWLMNKYPDTYVIGSTGNRFYYGSRRHYCVHSERYLEETRKIVTALAEHYKGEKRVIAWQIDNELGGDNDVCYCENCAKKFRLWLKSRYGSIGGVNAAWGTDVWSHGYNGFDEIEPPRKTQGVQNPSHVLDYKRFHSDSLANFQKLQADILKGINPSWRVTTNIFGLEAVTDNRKLAKDDDFVSWDFYPNMCFSPVLPYSHAMGADMCRGYKHKPFLRMETQSGTPGGDILFQTPRPGDLARWALQAVAHGADGIQFFRWRTSTTGPEEYWHGILGHDGRAGRIYKEAKELSAVLKKTEAAFGEKRANKAAILHNMEIHWAFEVQPLIIGYRYYDHLLAFYKALFDLGVGVDMISAEDSFDDYDFVIAPNYLFNDEALAARLTAFAEKGGTLLMDWRTGVKLEDNRVSETALPGCYAKLLGITVSEYGLIMDFEEKSVSGNLSCACKDWFDVIELTTAETWATFKTDDYYGGSPALTVNRIGRGKAYYLATSLAEDGLRALMRLIVGKTENQPVEGVEITEREGVVFVINHTAQKKEQPLCGEYEDVLCGERITACNLHPRGYKILKRLQ